MTYQETIEYLYSQLPMYQRVGKAAYKADLATTEALDKYFSSPHKSYPIIHIAGTNGKGSVAHSIASILQEAGLKTGLYTSPHLLDFRERIKVNGKPIPKEYVVEFVAKHRDIFQKLRPSFFEMTVAMAFEYFKYAKVDVAVIEVGMGGRLDSTNIVEPVLSVITNISYDHTQFLGDTLTRIAQEKAGIIKENVPVVVGERKPFVNSVFIDKAQQMHSPIYFANYIFSIGNYFITSDNKLSFSVFKAGKKYLDSLLFGLIGNYQIMNLPVIIQSYEILKNNFPLTEKHLREGLRNVIENTGIMGRWQIVKDKPKVILDAAHNSAGIFEAFSAFNGKKENLIVVFSMVKDKEIQKVLQLLPTESFYIFTKSSVERSEDAFKIKSFADRYGLNSVAINDLNEALNYAFDRANTHDIIFIGGSAFLVADALRYFGYKIDD